MASKADSAERTLDARQIDGEPFSEIMDVLGDLDTDQTLLLINSFEPEPLYTVLNQRGFSFETTQIDSEEWHILIEPE